MAERKVTNVGIAGPTGRFGSIVLESLLENPDIKIRGLCRNASKLNRKHTQSPQFEVISGDVLEPSILHKFVDGLDVVICAYLGDNDFMVNGQKALVDACEQAKSLDTSPATTRLITPSSSSASIPLKIR